MMVPRTNEQRTIAMSFWGGEPLPMPAGTPATMKRPAGGLVLRRVGWALVLTVVLVVLVPLLMIQGFNRQAPELYPLDPIPFSYEYIRY
jgi:hypothetical protein